MDEADWPAFDVPAGALDEGVTPGSASPAATGDPTPPVAPPPVAAATPPAQPATPPAAAPAAAAPGTPGSPAIPTDTVPKHRLDEVIGQRDSLSARIAQLERDLAAARTPPAQPAAPPPPAAPPDPANEAIRARLLEVFPELKGLADIAKLAERRGDLEGVIEANRRYESAEAQYYDQFTTLQIGRLYDAAALAVLGDGKKGSDLSPAAQETLFAAFYGWVTHPKHPEREQRYDALDPKVVDDFFAEYRASFIDPVRRATSATTLTSHANRPALPVGGTTPPAAPVPATTRPAASEEDEDAVHKRAYEQAMALVAQG